MSNRWSTRILEHNFLAADVRRLILEKPEQAPNFCAGQYLQLIVDDQRFPFSIASAPHTDHLELHIKPTEGSADSLKVEQYLKETNIRRFHISSRYLLCGQRPCMPCDSDCRRNWRDPDAKHCALATRAARSANRILVLGHVNSRGALSFQRTRQPRCQRPPLSVFSCCQPRRQRLERKKGLVVNAAIEDCEDLSSADIYISGSPTMVYGTLDRLVEEGIDADRVSADVFDYAPRK